MSEADWALAALTSLDAWHTANKWRYVHIFHDKKDWCSCWEVTLGVGPEKLRVLEQFNPDRTSKGLAHTILEAIRRWEGGDRSDDLGDE